MDSEKTIDYMSKALSEITRFRHMQKNIIKIYLILKERRDDETLDNSERLMASGGISVIRALAKSDYELEKKLEESESGA